MTRKRKSRNNLHGYITTEDVEALREAFETLKVAIERHSAVDANAALPQLENEIVHLELQAKMAKARELLQELADLRAFSEDKGSS
jgi:hypothetical protein